MSLPVTDPRGALLGRITVDDVVDVLQEEANEDFSKLSGLGEEEPLFDSPGRDDQAAAAVARAEPVHDQPERQRDRAVRGNDSQPRPGGGADDDRRRAGRQCRSPDPDRDGAGHGHGARSAWRRRAASCSRSWRSRVETGSRSASRRALSDLRCSTASRCWRRCWESALVANFLIAALVGSLIPLILRSLRAGSGGRLERLRHRLHGHVRVLLVPRPAVPWAPVLRLKGQTRI